MTLLQPHQRQHQREPGTHVDERLNVRWSSVLGVCTHHTNHQEVSHDAFAPKLTLPSTTVVTIMTTMPSSVQMHISSAVRTKAVGVKVPSFQLQSTQHEP